MIRISQIKMQLESTNKQIEEEILKKLEIKENPKNPIVKFEIYKRSIDARKSGEAPFYVYSVNVYFSDEKSIWDNIENKENIEFITEPQVYKLIPKNQSKNLKQPVIIGFGPAGMFCSLLLARAGCNPIIIERGKIVSERVNDVNEFWKNGKLNLNSNVLFGEGGAGTFSDGKLSTLVKDKEQRGRFVLSEFVLAGAPEEIMFINKPHIGTDKLRGIVQNIREEIIRLGGKFYFESTVTDIRIENEKIVGLTINNGESEIKTDNVFLAIGHSARDTFKMLTEHGVPMEQKAFAMGLRIEHLQKTINKSQYGDISSEILGAADYKMAYHTKSGRGVYTFCMCPGGSVIGATSEQECLAINGMSNYARDGKNANSALLVNVMPEDFGSKDVLAGVEMQRDLEHKAFLLGGSDWRAPVQRVESYLRKMPRHLGLSIPKYAKINEDVIPSYAGGTKYAILNEILPPFISETIGEGIIAFDRKMKGFASPEAILTGVETRSSSPVRILRNENMMSKIQGLWPVGEGAGYAGGIMSAAMDGMKAAEKYIELINQ